jgi:hypothetical protein
LLGVRRGSAQLGLTRQPSFRMKKNGTMSGMYPGPESFVECPYESIVELEAKQKEMEEKHTQARTAWRHFAKNLGQEDVNNFLSSRYLYFYINSIEFYFGIYQAI